jgi:glycosyltransferase involved in cell wall biosynthesis
MKVNVLLFTYNHVEFIEQALEGIRIQKTDFEFNVYISDDGSQDGTQEKIQSYLSLHSMPETKLFFQSKNSGIVSSAKSMLDAVDAPYFALLDGDDFWTDEFKLQKQIAFLEANPSFNGCIHNAQFQHENGADEILFKGNHSYHERYQYPKEIYPNNLIQRLILPTSSMVVRTDFIPSIPWSKFKDDYSVTWKITCFAIAKSKFHFINEEMSIYRNHLKGLSKGSRQAFHMSHIQFLKELKLNVLFELYHLEISQSIVFECRQILENVQLDKATKRRLFRVQWIHSVRAQWAYYKRIMN